MNSKWRLITSTAAAAAIAALAAAPANAQDRISLRWATADTGSYGYSVGSMISQMLESNLDGNYAITVQPYPSTTAAMKAGMNGEAEFSYTADVGMSTLYADEGAFGNFEPSKGKLVHTLYVYPMETFLVVPAGEAENYDSYADLDGAPIFFSPAGYMNWQNMRRVFDALGYEANHVEIDNSTVADALDQGTIDASVAYTTAGQSLPTWWREAELRTDVTVVNPTEEEIATLKKAGLTPTEFDTSAFSQDVGVDHIIGTPIWFGYNTRADMDAEIVEAVINAVYENIDSLAAGDPGFEPLANDFIGAQVNGISANPEIPVHPGLASFLKEHDAWNEDWTIAGSEG